jgi:hypothetical protein
MKVKMLIDQRGSEDGVRVKQFNQGQIYIMTGSLAGVFLKEKWAVEMDTPESLESERVKAINELEKELTGLVESCFEAGLDSIQLMDRIRSLKEFPVIEEKFNERFTAAQKKKAGISDAEKSLKALNKSNAKKGKKR